MFKRSIILDRDGTIIRLLSERGPRETALTSDEVELLPGAGAAIARLNQAGFQTFIASNQPNIAKGKCSVENHWAIHQRMVELLAVNNATIQDTVYCLHHPDPKQVVVKELLQQCDCRKPRSGLLRLLAKRYFWINLAESWMVGDAETDIQAGQAIGCKTIRIGPPGIDTTADYLRESLAAAVDIILEKGGK